MTLPFLTLAWNDYQYRIANNLDVLRRLNALIKEFRRLPFIGTGKPEPLKGGLKGWWARRLTLEDRLVYRVSESSADRTLEVARCRRHY